MAPRTFRNQTPTGRSRSTDSRTNSNQPNFGDGGIALISVMMILVIIGALTITLFSVTAGNLISARNSQQAGSALNASDAGVSQAVTYMRINGVAELNTCSPTCTSLRYGNSANPALVTVPGNAGQSYRVWIEVIAPYPANKPGVYKIHSTGFAAGPAGRKVTAMVAVDSYNVPIGLVANTVAGGGTADVHRASMFSTGCIYRRDQITFSGNDPVHGIPAAAHSAQYISTANGTGRYCPNVAQPIHNPNQPAAQKNCNINFPYDQDLNGGPLAGTPCQGPGGAYPQSSLMNDTLLRSLFNVSTPVFDQAQLDQLRTVAITQGNYYTDANSTSFVSPTNQHAVLYFDLTTTDPGGVVDLNRIEGWSRPLNLPSGSADCPRRSLLIVIEGGNAKLNSNQNLFAATFLVSDDPYGHLTKANGTAQYTGSIYANSIDLTGTSDMWMDECFAQNLPPALTSVEVYQYRELDR